MPDTDALPTGSAPAKARKPFQTVLRVALFAYFLAVTCPIQFFYFEDYLDLSWVLAINVAADQSLKFGENVFWTYGPFAYLGSPLPIGDNLGEALAMQSALWAAVAAVAVDLFFIQALPLGGLLALSLSTAMAWPLLHFNLGGTENLIAFLAYLLLASSLRAKNWLPRISLASVACGLAAMFKLSAAVSIAGGLVGAVAVMLYRSRRQGAWALAIVTVAAPLSFIGFYWMHNPSWRGLQGYLWGLGEFSAGYSTAMSATGVPLNITLGAAAEVGLCIALLLHERWKTRDGSFALMAIFLLPVGLSFKHMGVRLDFMHLPAFFSLAGLVMGCLLAFRERPAPKPALSWVVFALGSGVILFFTQTAMLYWSSPGSDLATAYRRVFSGAASMQHVERALDVEQAQNDLLSQSAVQLEGQRLPIGIREKVGSRPVGFFGSNYPFAIIDDLNLRLVPVPQVYATFTAALDQLCADWYREDGPEVLLMDWSAIDNRHPLTQAPRSWLEVWRWYDAELQEGPWLLLTRRNAERFGEPNLLSTEVVHGEQAIKIPSEARPLLVAVRRSLSLSGRMAQTFFQVPAIAQRYERRDSSSVEHRAILNVMDYPTLIRPLPASLDEVARLLASNSDSSGPDSIESFSFVGTEDYYSDEYEVEFYTLEGSPVTGR